MPSEPALGFPASGSSINGRGSVVSGLGLGHHNVVGDFIDFSSEKIEGARGKVDGDVRLRPRVVGPMGGNGFAD